MNILSANGRWPYWLAATLLTLTLVVGGSVQALPMLRLADQLLAVGVIVVVLISARTFHLRGLALFGCILCIAIAALPLLQIVPLPAGIWHAFPGRDVPSAVGAVFGFDTASMPLSLDPDATFASLLGALPAFAAFAVAHKVNAPGHVRLLLVLVGLALLSLVIGVVQVTTGQGYFYETAHEGLPIGLFANRNHQADLMLVGIIVSMVLGTRPQLFPGLRLFRPALFAAAAAMTAGVVATGSRSGMALLLYAVVAVFLLSGKVALSPKRMAIAAVATVIIPLCLILAGSQVVTQSLHRFDRQQTDQRFDFWPAARWTAEHYFPAGAGIGTFDPVFRANEPLSLVGAHYIVHAHNEYIEIPLEGGLPGLLLILCFCIWWALATIRVGKADGRDLDALLGRIGSALIPIFLLHSAFDYPLRMIGLMTVFGFACGLLSRALLWRVSSPSPVKAQVTVPQRHEARASPGGNVHSFRATRKRQAPIDGTYLPEGGRGTSSEVQR